MKKLNILMIASEFPPKCAGIGMSAYWLSKALVKKGHNVTVLTRGKHFTETKRNMDGITVIELPFIALIPPFHLMYHGYFLNKKIGELETSFDVIHLHTPLVPKIKSNIPKITSVHSLWMEETRHFNDGTDAYSLAVRLFKKQVVDSEIDTLRQTDRIIAYPNYADKLKKFYRIKSTPISTTNGMIYSDLSVKQNIKQKYDVIFVGRLNIRKGVKELLSAA